jgi:hypothetical protein
MEEKPGHKNWRKVQNDRLVLEHKKCKKGKSDASYVNKHSTVRCNGTFILQTWAKFLWLRSVLRVIKHLSK